ncbi:MAG TPA: cellulose binding domain-containing protein [Solirubrobacteraceae bacterium]|nr:cellulose binding domain-containing protein [Solirubrobacteraceae bacterium]
MPLLRKTLLLLVVLSAALAAPAVGQAAGLSASFSTSSDWGSGFVGAYTITNGGTSPVTGWRLEFDLPLNESITGAWSGQLSSLGGHYVVTNASWNQTIAPGTSVNPGFQGAYTGTFTPPQNCLIND